MKGGQSSAITIIWACWISIDVATMPTKYISDKKIEHSKDYFVCLYLSKEYVNSCLCTCFSSSCRVWPSWAASIHCQKPQTETNHAPSDCMLLKIISKGPYLAKADWIGGNFDLRLLRPSRRSFTGDVKELRSTNTFLYSLHTLFGDLTSPFRSAQSTHECESNALCQ